MTTCLARPSVALVTAGIALASASTLCVAELSQPDRQSQSVMQEDLKHRSLDIRWAPGFEPANADIFSHNELYIDAGCERVWNKIVDATQWPAWYPNSTGVAFVSDSKILHEGAIFSWTTFGLQLESRVREFVPFSRIGWYGYTPGTAPSFYHTWLLSPKGRGCQVVTDEVGMGKDAKALRSANEGLMHRGHDLWLATLKWAVESQ